MCFSHAKPGKSAHATFISQHLYDVSFTHYQICHLWIYESIFQWKDPRVLKSNRELQKYKTRSDDHFLIVFVSFNLGQTVDATTSLLKNCVKSENRDALFVKWLNGLKSLPDVIWFRCFRIVFNYNDAVNHTNDINGFTDVLGKFTIFKTNRLVFQWFILYISSIVCLISNPQTHFGFLLPSILYSIFEFIWIKQMP